MITIEDVHKEYKKHMYLENTNFIDTLLATYMTTRLTGEPLWLFPIAPSSYGKTEMQKPFIEMSKESKYKILMLDQVTSKSFASGRKESEDLGAKLQNERTFVLIPDLASILSSSVDDKSTLFAAMRTLYDGYIIRYTGNEKKIYRNCHINMFACSTPAIRGNIEFFGQMGTREILYDVGGIQYPDNMLEANVDNDARESIANVVKSFVDDNVQGVDFTEQPILNDFVKNITKRIATWRVEPTVDEFGYLTQQVIPEYTPRLYKQLSKLCVGLNAIGISQNSIKRIIIEIEQGCGNNLRRQIYRALYRTNEQGFSTPTPKSRWQIANELNRSKKEVLTQLMVLRELGDVSVMPRAGDTRTLDIFNEKAIWQTDSDIY